MASDRWTRFGWQGISIEVPADWELRRYDGTRRRGYARLSDADRVRVELRWDRSKREVDFESLADRAIRRIAKDKTFEIERRTALVELPGRNAETFACRAKPAPPDAKTRPPDSSYNLIASCRECRRRVMVRVAFARGENLKATATRVLGSVQDHSYDGADLWSAYGLTFAVPEDMTLDRAMLYPGSLDFRFERRKDWIEVGRIALGSMILKRVTLDDWFGSFARKRFRKVRYEAKAARVLGHEGLEVTGRLRGVGALIPKLVRRQRFACRVWHCDKADKLYFFSVLGRPRVFDRYLAYAERVVCHGQQ